MFSCLQILEAFLWFVLITLLNVTLIILTLSVSRLLNLLLRLVAFLLFLNRSEERFSRNAETDLVCRLLLEKKKNNIRGNQGLAGLADNRRIEDGLCRGSCQHDYDLVIHKLHRSRTESQHV